MCEPTTLVLAATAMQAVGSVVQGVNQSRSMKYQAKVSERNAALDRRSAQDAVERGRIEEMREGRKTAQLIGAQRAAMAANGIELDYGSAALIQEDTKRLGWEDASTARENAMREAKGYEISAWNSDASAASSRAGAKSAMLQTAFDVGGTLLGGAQQFRKAKAQGY